MLEEQIKLPVVIEGKEVEVNFYYGQRLLTIHSNFRVSLDPCHGGSTLNTTPEDQILFKKWGHDSLDPIKK